MNYPSYLPVLKWKKGEQRALQELKLDNPVPFIPIIELVEECTPEDFFSIVNNYYSGTFYYDTERIDDSNRSIISMYIKYAIDNEIKAWPLLYADDLYSKRNKTIHMSSRFAIKLPIPEDYEGPSNENIIQEILKHADGKVIDLILDAGEVINRNNANIVISSYKKLLNPAINLLNSFNLVIVSLTSFPEQLTIESGGDAEFFRYDIKIFEKLIDYCKYSDIATHLAYSDYGVTKFTETELDFSKMRFGVLPKVKYTTQDKYIVLKGEKDRSKGVFTRSYIDISNEIINAKYYFGNGFSFGDASIYDKAINPKATPGNNTNWVTYCANHHLAVIIEQLSKLNVI